MKASGLYAFALAGSDIHSLLVVIGLLLSALTTEAAQKQGNSDQTPLLSLEGPYQRIVLTKSEYLKLEPIYAYTWIENRSGEPRKYKRKWWLEFRLEKETGEELPLRCGWLNSELCWEELSPDSASTCWIDELLQHFGDYKHRCMDNSLPSGKYRVYAKDFPSDTVEFVVVEPTSPDDKSVAQGLLEYFNSDQERNISSADEIPIYEHLLTDFPGSSYAPHIIRQLIIKKSVMEGSKGNVGLHKYSLDLIMNYPTSPSTAEALIDLSVPNIPSSMRDAVRLRLASLSDSLLDGVSRRQIAELLAEFEK